MFGLVSQNHRMTPAAWQLEFCLEVWDDRRERVFLNRCAKRSTTSDFLPERGRTIKHFLKKTAGFLSISVVANAVVFFGLEFGGTESFGRNEIFQDRGWHPTQWCLGFHKPSVRIPSLKWVFPKIGVYNPPKMDGLKKMVGKSLFFNGMIWGKTPYFFGWKHSNNQSFTGKNRTVSLNLPPKVRPRVDRLKLGVWPTETGFREGGKNTLVVKRLPFEAWNLGGTNMEKKHLEVVRWGHEFPTLEGLVSCHFCESSAEMKFFGHDNWSNRWWNNDMRYNEEAIHSAIVPSCTWLDFNHISLKKKYMDVSENRGTPKSSIFIRFSI